YLARLAPSSRRAMFSALGRIAQELTGQDADPMSLPWHQLEYAHTIALRSRLAADLAPATANRHLAALRGVLQEAWRLGIMDAEAYRRATDLKPVRGRRERTGREVTAAEAATFLEACRGRGGVNGARDAAAFALLYGAGLRRAEVVAAERTDLDVQEGRLLVRGKGNKQRTIYLDRGSLQALQDWLAYRGDEPGPLIQGCTTNGKATGRRLTTTSLYRALDRRRREAGIAPFTPHDLRRSYGGDLLDAGADLATVSAMMGHADPATTAGYDRRGDRAKRKVATLRQLPY
ncbi:MAG: tyrosine-type recombinase/integrase, partial [Halorhodospira sp.]